MNITFRVHNMSITFRAHVSSSRLHVCAYARAYERLFVAPLITVLVSWLVFESGLHHPEGGPQKLGTWSLPTTPSHENAESYTAFAVVTTITHTAMIFRSTLGHHALCSSLYTTDMFQIFQHGIAVSACSKGIAPVAQVSSTGSAFVACL